jgi:hypothetical protein
MSGFEHYRDSGPKTGWWILIVFTAVILATGMLVHHAIMDGPRQWDFGAVPDAPGETVYSMRMPGRGAAPRQMAPLPEAVTGSISTAGSGTAAGGGGR